VLQTDPPPPPVEESRPRDSGNVRK
jgi:hypothetical protein